MFRLSQTNGHDGTVVNVDGQLTGDGVQIIEEYCSQVLLAEKRLSLFLRDVSVIDEAGRDLLRRLANQGVRLLASGLYTSHLVENLQRGRAVRVKPAC